MNLGALFFCLFLFRRKEILSYICIYLLIDVLDYLLK